MPVVVFISSAVACPSPLAPYLSRHDKRGKIIGYGKCRILDGFGKVQHVAAGLKNKIHKGANILPGAGAVIDLEKICALDTEHMRMCCAELAGAQMFGHNVPPSQYQAFSLTGGLDQDRVAIGDQPGGRGHIIDTQRLKPGVPSQGLPVDGARVPVFVMQMHEICGFE